MNGALENGRRVWMDVVRGARRLYEESVMRNRWVVIALMIGSLGLLTGTNATCFARGDVDTPTVIVD